MNSLYTLTQVLESQSAAVQSAGPKGITFIEGEHKERFVSYQHLQQRALGILHYFQRKGMQPGDELLLVVNRPEQLVDAFWAALLGKIVAVPLAVGIHQEHRLKLFRIYRKLRHPYLYTDRANLNRLKAFAEENGLNAEFDAMQSRTVLVEDIEDISTPGQVYPARPDDVAFIQFSSGSTSTPKGVVLTHRNLMVNIHSIVAGARLTDTDTCFSWMPLTHDMGLIGFHLVPLVTGINQVLMTTELFVRRPMLWWQKASLYRATVTCSPNFGYQHFLQALDQEIAPPLDLSSIRLILNGAEPISVPLCERFMARMMSYGLRSNAMFPVYGLAEATLAVTFPIPGEPLKIHQIDRFSLQMGETVNVLSAATEHSIGLLSEGKPVENCAVEIRNETGAALADGMVGLIYIKGENVTRGYYHDEAANQELFSADGWLNTGDLGFLLHGELVVTGRYKDIIFYNGQNFYPHDLEALAEAIQSIGPGKVAVCGVPDSNATTEQVLVFVVHKGSVEAFAPLVKTIRGLLNEKTGLEIGQVIPVRQLPKTTSGKLQRYRLGERFRQGEFDEILQLLNKTVQASQAHEADPSQIEQVLLHICEICLSGRKISVYDNLFEMGTTSLALAQIHEKVDEHWPGKLEITDYFDAPTIAQLAAYLSSQNGHSRV